MQDLPEEIKIQFYKFLNGEEPIQAFEQWVYATRTLEELLDGESYFALISLDFSKSGSCHELIKLLEQTIDAGEYETWKLKRLLNQFLSQEGNLPTMLGEFYELYCNGFYFLDTLGFGCGLTLVVPPNHYSSDTWDELTSEEKESLLGSVLPGALEEAEKVLNWLDQGKIVITKEQDGMGRYLYLDRRTEAEQNPNLLGMREWSDTPSSKPWWKLW
jgi:hypothetical protein